MAALPGTRFLYELILSIVSRRIQTSALDIIAASVRGLAMSGLNWIRISVILFFYACVPLFLGSCLHAGSSTAVSQRETLYDRVMRTGKIRCGYVVYFPDCIKDPNSGKLSGIGIDTLEMVANKLGLKVEWTEEVGWGSMLEGLQTGRYDLVPSLVWTNSNRAKLMDFSQALFYSPIYVYIRPGEKRFSTSLENINSPDVKIVVMDGETAQVIANNDFPKAKQVSLPQLSDYSQVLLTLATKKADLALVEPSVTIQFLKSNPGAVTVLDPAHPIRVFPNCWMFNRGEMEFKNMIDTVLAEVQNSGALEKILKKYEPAPNTLFRVALPYKMPGK